ncbi:MAG: hypothetical protein ABH805_01710 [Candidatus Nealsonbacteria bacterium]
MKKKMPRSIRKFIRLEKARIRRGVLDAKSQKELIDELYKKHLKANDNTGNIQSGDK